MINMLIEDDNSGCSVAPEFGQQRVGTANSVSTGILVRTDKRTEPDDRQLDHRSLAQTREAPEKTIQPANIDIVTKPINIDSHVE